jgi:thiamine-monophosphate kinase
VSLALGPGIEFDRIRAIARALGSRASGLGDDCALINHGRGTLAISTDASVEGTHFRLDWITAREAGWRATAAALSDLAAEGAAATGVLTAVVAPVEAREQDLVALMEGVGDAAANAGADVIGGDLTRSGDAWMIAVTVLGPAERPVTRAGALPGDGVWVTGVLGGARSALEAWHRGEAPDPQARERFARPLPRIAAGRWLAEHGAHGMLDLSDGLGGDAGHLASASEVALDLELDFVPIHPAAVAEAQRLGEPVQQFAAEGGEDYELLVALPEGFNDTDVREFERACSLALTRIGRVGQGRGVRSRLAGRPLALRGYDHFR